jgi:hypothetical protein
MFLCKKKVKHVRIFTTEVIETITSLYLSGYSIDEICEELSILRNTFLKAVSQKRLILPSLSSEDLSNRLISTKSARSALDNTTGMGKSCLNETGRVKASYLGIPAESVFGNHLDLSHGGLLLTLPALLACGLLSHISDFERVSGYYSATKVFLSLAFLSLLRVNKLEQTDTVPTGELGRCLGLDRIPEVKTLRKRIDSFCQVGDVEKWLSSLSREWMQTDETFEGVLYVDGHVNLYYGHQTQMPKRFVSRFRLCLSGSTDYWVNDQMGQPFFVVHKTINDGLIKVLQDDIIPRLNADVPNQPTEEELAANDKLHRYMVVFDREGYSIELFKYLQKLRIAFCTYRKNVKENWPEEDFADYEVSTHNGDTEIMQLAEKQTVLYGKKEKGKPQKEIIVREIRKKTESGHQTSIITTNYMLSLTVIAFLMFSRWCQENFFKYMVESFGIDSITSYFKNCIPDRSSVINPEYKELDRQHKSINTRINNRKLKFAQISLQNKEMSKKEIERYTKKKSDIQLEIEDLENQRKELIDKKKIVKKKILFKDLDENQKFSTSINERKIFLDIIKIIAYRAETALCNIIKKRMSSPEEARTLIRKLYAADADIEPDEANSSLIVKLHRTNHWADDDILEFLCNNLNETQTVFPETNLTCFFKLGTS